MRITAYFFLLMTLFVAGCHPPDAIDSQGKKIYLSDYRGKWLVINYWATWCKSCVTELPQLSALQQKYPTKIAVIGVNFDHLSAVDIKKFMVKVPVIFPVVSTLATEKINASAIPALPMSYLLDPQGNLFKVLPGPQTVESFEAILRGKL